MADISILSRLLNGLQRNVDLSTNSLVVGSLKVGSVTPTELTKAILDRLVALQNGTDVDATYHTHDGRYYTESELGAITGTTGSDLIGDDNTYSNFTPTTTTVKGALAGIDSALSTGNGKVKVTSADTNADYLNNSITAGSGLSKSVTNPGADEVLDLAVNVDDSTIEINSDTLRLKDLGITNAKISATAAIDATKLADGSVSNTELQYINSLTSNAQTQLTNNATAISDHLSDASDAHDASAISSVPAGNLAATDVQAALNELDSEKVAKSGDTMSGNLAMGSNKVTGLAAGTTAGDAVRYEQAILASGVNAFAAAQSMGGFKLTNLADGTASSDAINKGQLDAALNGLRPKQAARVATTANITIATALNSGDVIDGITLADGDRVLVKDQSTTSENGIYVVGATPARATDFDSVSPIDEINGAMVPIEEGTANAGKIFVQSGAAVATVGTDPIAFVYFNSVSNLAGDDGITISGISVSVDHDGNGLTFSAGQLALELDGSTLSKSASGVKVASGGITNTEVNASAAIAYSKLNIADGDLTIAKTNGLQSALDGKVDENAAITGATKTKITYDAKGLVTAGADATTADIADSTNKRYVTDADLVDIGNLSGTNTGDQTITLTGDVTGSGTGSFATSIASDAVTTTKILNANVTLAKLASDSVDENKIVSTVHDASMTGGSGSKLAVAYAPRGQTTVTAGESMAANTSFLVRWALNGETAGRVYKADKDTSSADKFYAFGIALSTSAVSAAGSTSVIFEGTHTLGSSDANFGGTDIGKAVYLTAAGAFSVTPPTTVGDAVYRIGTVQAVDKIWVGGMQINGIN